MGINLYDIGTMYQEGLRIAEEMINPETGELPEDWSKFLDEINEVRELKVLNIARFIKNLDAEQDAIKAEAQKLSERAKSCGNKSEWLKKYLVSNVSEGETFSDANTEIKWRKSASTQVLDIEALRKIDERFVKIDIKPIAAEVKKAIQGGFIPADVAVIVNKQNMQIA
jgi:hypothetical protein